MTPPRGVVYLIGAGPGDPGLLTVRGLEILRRADVVLHDRLVSPAVLAHCRRSARMIDVGKSPGRVTRSQDGINALLVAAALRNRTVVRLKGGDPFVFGRGYEELEFCRAAGVECEVIPGVTSAVAVPAGVGVPVTHRNVARSFAVVTGRVDGADLPPHDYSALAKIDTLCLLMGRSNLRALANALITAGRDPSTPATAIAAGTTPDEHVVTGTLATIAERVEHIPPKLPLTTVIGPTAAFAQAQAAATAEQRAARDEEAA